MKTFFKILGIVLAVLIVVLALAWLGLSIAKYNIYSIYLQDQKDEAKIPGLNDGFCPQGIAVIDGQDAYLHSGYNGDEMVLYYAKGDDVRKFTPLAPDGTVAKGHAGGVSVSGDYVYIASECKLWVYRLSDILSTPEGGKLSCAGCHDVDNQASFCYIDDKTNQIYVGEFYRPTVYETDSGHHFTTPEGEEHKAIMSCYQILEDGSVESIPEFWVSIPDQVQGVAYTNGMYVLSRSWGLNSSNLDFYSGMRELGKTAPYANKEVKIYYLGSENLVEQLKTPAFSEGLDAVDDRLYITYESACNKYIVGKLFFAFHVESYPVRIAAEKK